MKYRKKPIIIEAVQLAFDLETMSKISDMGGPGTVFSYKNENPPVFKIETLEGALLARVGDWVIKSVKGGLYPCRDDVFQASYELAE